MTVIILIIGYQKENFVKSTSMSNTYTHKEWTYLYRKSALEAFRKIIWTDENIL